MAKRAIIRLGDRTSHGGTVLEAFPTFSVYGKNAAGLGHKGYCPQCKKEFVIVAAAKSFTFLGKNVAVEGMQTSCGAVLIASQSQATVDDAPGSQSVMAATPMDLVTSTSESQDLEYFFVAERQDGSMVNLAYRIDADGEKLHEGRLDSDGATAAFPMSKAGEPTFWIPLA